MRLGAISASLPPVHLRRATTADIPAIMAIEARCFRSDRASAPALRRLMRSSSSAVFVASVGGEVAGYIGLLTRADSDCARIYAVALRADVRGRGIGLALMRRAERTARSRGAMRMRLEVRVSNRRARGLYRALGYESLKPLPGYYGDGGDALRMEKLLSRKPHRRCLRAPTAGA